MHPLTRLLLVLGLFTSPAWLEAAEAPAAATPWFEQVKDAAALGDNVALRELLKGEIPPAPAELTPYAYHTTLALAAVTLGDVAGILRFMEQAGEPAPGETNLVWIAAVAWVYQGDRDRALRMAKNYRRLEENHPAAAFLEALDAYSQWRQLGPLHPEAADRYQTAVRRIEEATDQAAQARPGYHRRFEILACNIAEYSDHEYAFSSAVVRRYNAYPRNRAFARAYLASTPVRPEDLAPVFAAAALDPAETAVWTQDAEQVALSRQGLAERLARFPARPEFNEPRLIILRAGLREAWQRLAAWRKQFAADAGPGLTPAARTALAEIPGGLGDQFPALLQTYARLAADLGKGGDAARALRLIDAVRALDEGTRVADAELEIPLAKLAGDPRRALALVLAQAPAHAQDELWLRTNGALVQQFAELPQALAYISHLAQMVPDDLRIQFSLASLADRPVNPDQRRADLAYVAQVARARVDYTPEQLAADPDNVLNSDRERLNLYARLFARVPADLVPEARHWQSYEALLDRNVFSEAFLEGLTEAEVKGRTFRALVERCRREAPQDPVIGAQYGRLLARDATALARQAEKAPAPEAAALWEKTAALVKTAAVAGATAEQLKPARERIEEHARSQREARRLQAAADAEAAARRVVEERNYARQRRQEENVDRARARLRYLLDLGVAQKQILKEAQDARRPYYTTRQGANAANAASLSKQLEALCDGCSGLGLASAGPGLVRPCGTCGGSGLQYWAKQKGMVGARFEGADPFPFDLGAALR